MHRSAGIMYTFIMLLDDNVLIQEGMNQCFFMALAVLLLD